MLATGKRKVVLDDCMTRQVVGFQELREGRAALAAVRPHDVRQGTVTVVQGADDSVVL